MLAIYVFVELMSRVKPKEFNLRKFFAANRTLCIFLIFWLISLLFEANGGRAQSMAHEESYILLVLYTAAALIQSLLLDNRGLALIIFAIVTLPFMWRANKDLWRVTKKFLLCLPLWTVYIILVTARAEATYALRPDVQFGFFFIVFVIFLTALGFWIKKFPRAALVLPILCFALFTWIFSGKRTFCPSTFNHVPESVCIQVSQHIMNQIIAADRAGFKEVTITVPKGDDVDNYPHPLYMGNNISRTLHAHGMISRRLEVKVQPDATLNERFNLP